jgi:cation diffusion facilitator family transporter
MTPSDRATSRVLLWVLGANLAVAGVKYVAGRLTGSLALTADAVHSALDASSNIVGLLGVWAASRPASEGHPYGNRRLEAVAAGIIGLLILGGFVEVVHQIVTGWDRLPPEVTWAAVGVVVGTIVVNVLVSRYEHREGDRLGSIILTADAHHTASDAASALVVLASLAGTAAGIPHADSVAAVIVCGFIGRAAWLVLKDALVTLSDAARLDPAEVVRVACTVPGVVSAHKVRSRGTLAWVHVDLHIQLDPETTLADAHERTHAVAEALRQAFPELRDVVIHTEPEGPRHGVEPAGR